MLHLNEGGGILSDIAQLAGVGATDWSWTVLMADFDNDGWKDINIVNGLMRDIRDYDAARAFPKYVDKKIQAYLKAHPNPENLSLWDVVNIDSAMNISPSVKLQNYMFRNKGDYSFENVSDEWGLKEKTFSNGAAYADLDNDGDLDLVINNINDLALVYRNNADQRPGNHFIRVIPVADRSGVTPLNTKVWVEAGGEKQYFEITSARGMYSTSEHIAHFGLGDKKKVDRIIVEWPDGKRNILMNQRAGEILKVKYSKASLPAPGQVRGDPTLFTNVTEKIGLVVKHTENRFDDFEKQMMLPHKFSDRGPCIAVGDVDGDGLDDIYTGGSAGYLGRLFKQNREGFFSVMAFPDLALDKKSEDVDALFFDPDADGDLDLYVVSGGNEYRAGSAMYQDRLYLNDGMGHFTKSEGYLPKLVTSGSKVIAGDYDGDGDPDLFIGAMHTPWQYPEPPSSTLLKNEGGKFTDVTQQTAPDLIKIGMVNDAVWVDFDQDGWLDLALVGEWMPMTLLKNESGKFVNVTRELGLGDTSGWWFSIKAADMDGDGDTDFILGNLGLNFEYRATVKRPFQVFYYDFDNNGSGDIVLAYYQGNKLYPVRERNRSVRQVPLLAKKFKTFHAFAQADVYEIYGKSNLKNALHYEAKTLASYYVENKGDGKFEFHPLPVEAQFSSINDMIIKDFNGDGHPDILEAGNLFGMEVETVRPDAGVGLFLAGDGKGNFYPMNYLESGFLLPYDVKKLRIFNYQGKLTIIAGCNNDFYQLFGMNN